MLQEKLDLLCKRRSYGIKFDLVPMQSVLSLMGNPHDGLRVIHVAGTNGKGSVCAMLESVLRRAGFKTGLYTSPHLAAFNERIKVAGAEITDERIAGLFDLVEKCSSEYAASPGGRELTFFEFVTAMAFGHFRSEETDVVVLETGMGGRLDATNVVDPVLSVITGVSMEHSAYLGDTPAEIAVEKAGVIKRNRPVVIGAMSGEVEDVISAAASAAAARVVRAGDIVSVVAGKRGVSGQLLRIETGTASYGSVNLPLLGRHQMENCAVVVAALEVFAAEQNVELAPEALRAGLESVVWPGRLQVLCGKPPVMLDGAHNPEAASVLARAISDLFPGRRVGLVAGVCEDKDIDGFLAPFRGIVSECWAVGLNNERARAPSDIAGRAAGLGWNARESGVEQALVESMRWADEADGVVCICGSLFLCGEVLAIFEQRKNSNCDEQNVNVEHV